MRISWNYLQSFFEQPLEKAVVLERLTLAGIEVEDEVAFRPQFSGVVVAEVISCEKHPDADKLNVCQVNVGNNEVVQIICGAANVKVGIKAPCAKVGAVLPNDFAINERKMRGLTSYGMLCSGEEIACPDGVYGLLILPNDAPVGTNIREYLALDDSLVEFKITPNRGDCLSYLGIAREIAALMNLTLKPQSHYDDNLISSPAEFAVNVVETNNCPSYIALILNNLNNQQNSPIWLVNFLESSKIRSVSPIVDIANYVMLVLGQPLHAFDRALVGNLLTVRMAQHGEPIHLIDDSRVTLTSDTLVIADEWNKPAAIAGVIGSFESAVSVNTTSIVLESAFFTPQIIRGKAKYYKVNSDAAYRFERGVDYTIQDAAIKLAAKLIVEICGGEVTSQIKLVENTKLPTSNPIVVDLELMNKLIGQEVPKQKVEEILHGLGLKPEATTDSQQILKLTPPSYRFDLTIKEDILEEVIRVYGYDRIIPQLPKLTHRINVVDYQVIKHDLFEQVLVGYGFSQVISYAFIEDSYAKLFSRAPNDLIKLQNPIAGLNQLRDSLIPGLIKTLTNNVNRGHKAVRIFENARVFHGETPDLQPNYLAGLIYGEIGSLSWTDKVRMVDFYDLKGIIEELLQRVDGAIKFIPVNNSLCHPGRSAKIMLADYEIGLVGQLHPRFMNELNIGELPYLFEINTDLINLQSKVVVKPVSKFQKVTRDLAFVMQDQVSGGEVLDYIKALEIPNLSNCQIFDVYHGDNLANNEKSIALNFVFHADKTLVDEEINSRLEIAKQAVINKFSARLR